MKHKLLFVCLGNICRSAAADGIMHKIALDQGLDIEIDSAGTYGGHAGELPDSRMRRAAAKRGYDLSHRSRQLNVEDFYNFDTIVVMDDSNMQNTLNLSPERKYSEKLHRMIDFCKDRRSYDYIPDPYYEGVEGFELVLDLLEDGCLELAKSLSK